MNSTDSLKRDHTLILEGLDALQAVAEKVRNGGSVPVEAMQKLVEFFRDFADVYHHRKEEEALFPALEAAGMPKQHGPIGVMLREHDIGRQLLRQIGTNLPRLDPTVALDYVNLLSSHIDKENEVLFVMADRILTAEADKSISEQFRKADDAMPNVVDHEAHRKLFADLHAAGAS